MTNHFLPQEHEQNERDYYDRENERKLNNCLFSFKALAVIASIVIILMLLFACSPKPYALLTEAIPMRQDGDRVLAVFQSVHGSPERYHAQWFYFPGFGLIDPHQYRIRVILERRSP